MKRKLIPLALYSCSVACCKIVRLAIIMSLMLAAVYAAEKRGGASDPFGMKSGKYVSGVPVSVTQARALISKLEPLCVKMSKPQPGDWLYQFKEPGQSFDQWLKAGPRMAKPPRRIIYVQPLGEFDASQKKIVDMTAEFMGLYFNLPVKMLDGLKATVVPKSARRINPGTGQGQVLTTYVLDRVLKPALPKDAAVLIALTAEDLWPGSGWNFVFGQASLADRVGVWSLSRMGDSSDAQGYELALLRTLKIATHETGHMFTIQHCIAWECNMNGCNHREEADRNPLWCCPECVAKLWVATGADPVKRYSSLALFCSSNNLMSEAEYFSKAADAIGKEGG